MAMVIKWSLNILLHIHEKTKHKHIYTINKMNETAEKASLKQKHTRLIVKKPKIRLWTLNRNHTNENEQHYIIYHKRKKYIYCIFHFCLKTTTTTNLNNTHIYTQTHRHSYPTKQPTNKKKCLLFKNIKLKC